MRIATLLLFFAVAYASAATPPIARSAAKGAPVVKHHNTKPIELQTTPPPAVHEKVVGPVIIDEVPIRHEYEDREDDIGEAVFGEEHIVPTTIGTTQEPIVPTSIGTTPPAVEAFDA